MEKLDTLHDLDDKIAELTDDEKELGEEIDRSSEFRRFMKEIIRKIDNITKQHGYEPPSTVAATGTVQKVETVTTGPNCQNCKLKNFVEKLLNGHPFMIHSRHP